MEPAVQVDGTLKIARGGDLFEVRRLAFEVSQDRRSQPPGRLLTRRELGEDNTPVLPPVADEPEFDRPAGRQADDNEPEPVEASSQGGTDS